MHFALILLPGEHLDIISIPAATGIGDQIVKSDVDLEGDHSLLPGIIRLSIFLFGFFFPFLQFANGSSGDNAFVGGDGRAVNDVIIIYS